MYLLRSSDVPVLPPTVYPSTFAPFPVPSETTEPIISLTLLAVSSDIVFVFITGSISLLSPVSESITAVTNLGVTRFPPFAMLATAVTSCIGVISNLCPKEIVASSTGPTFSSLKNMLFASPQKVYSCFFLQSKLS